MEVSPDPSPFPGTNLSTGLNWIELFPYPAGPLPGNGPWVGSSLTGPDVDVIAAGDVRVGVSLSGGAFADDAFTGFDVTLPWTFTVEFFLATPAGTSNTLSLFIGDAAGTYVGLDLNCGSTNSPGATIAVAEDGCSGGTITNNFGGQSRTPVNLGAVNTVVLQYLGGNLFDIYVNGSLRIHNTTMDPSTITDPYPEFDYQSVVEPASVRLVSMQLQQA